MEASQQIQAAEPAFRYGQGFFTTTRVKGFIPIWLPAHVHRLNRSLHDFMMPGLNEDRLLGMAGNWPVENQLPEGFLRILVWEEKGAAHFHLTGGMLDNVPRKMKLMVSRIRRHSSDPLLGYKSFNYWNNQLAYQEALLNGCDEAILLNEKGEITESSRNNIFWIKEGVLFTPQLACGLLPGIARSHLMTIAREQGMELQEGGFSQEDLEAAETVFLSNSVHGIREVVRIGSYLYKANKEFHLLQQRFEQKEANFVKLSNEKKAIYSTLMP